MSATARRFVDWASALLLVAVLVVTLLQVGARYVFNWPMPWSEELTRLIFVWLVMIAAVGSAHMRIEFFAQRMPASVRRVVTIALALLSIALLALVAWKSLGLIELTRNDRYSALGVSVSLLYWAALSGCTLWIVSIVAQVGGEVRKRY
jgi:TRAP-type C4-dicarboxylate transport system permease small subunit